MPDSVTDYLVSGVFNDGGVVSGSLEVDNSTGQVTGYVTTSPGLTSTGFFIQNYNSFFFTSVGRTGAPISIIGFDVVSAKTYDIIFGYGVVGVPSSQPQGAFEYLQDNSATGVSMQRQVEGAVLTPVCFAEGTRIRTTRGNVAVEALAVGDLVVTASGATRPITWIGQRTIDCARHPRANEVLPVRIAAHAFAENRPARDLVVSPGHSIAVDLLGEVLIPASSLINGTTIRQESVERVTYWHVELESHDLLMAENLPTESYMEMGNRGFFPRPGEAMALHGVPDAVPATHADFCRPFHAAGPVVDFVRDRLAARALQLDWVQVENTFADLHLVVDGRRVEAEVQGLSARFLVPATAETVWLESDTIVPAIAGGGADLRALGVCVGKLVIDDGFGPLVVMADDPRLSVGFHHVEEGPQRWTAGRARLPASLWAGCRGSFFLRVDLTRPALPRWTAAAAPNTAERHAIA